MTRRPRAIAGVTELAAAPWAVWPAVRTLIAGSLIGLATFGAGHVAAGSVAYFAVACATSFSILGSLRLRVRRTAVQTAGAALGFVIAGFAPHTPWALVAVAVVAAFVSGVAGRFGEEATAAAMMMLVTLAYGEFAPNTLTWPEQVGWYAVGSAVVIALAALPVGAPIPAPPPVAEPFPRDHPGRATVIDGMRLALCFGVATLLAATLDQGRHSFWLPLTVAVVVRTEYGTVIARVTNRAGGTVVGAVLAGLVITLLPSDVAIAAIAVVGMSLAALTASRHYGLSVVGITLSALLSGEIGVADPTTPWVRIGDTLLGCLVALVLGHFVWRRWSDGPAPAPAVSPVASEPVSGRRAPREPGEPPALEDPRDPREQGARPEPSDPRPPAP